MGTLSLLTFIFNNSQFTIIIGIIALSISLWGIKSHKDEKIVLYKNWFDIVIACGIFAIPFLIQNILPYLFIFSGTNPALISFLEARHFDTVLFLLLVLIMLFINYKRTFACNPVKSNFIFAFVSKIALSLIFVLILGVRHLSDNKKKLENSN